MSVVQVNPASHQLSVIASNTLAKCGFLCQVLAENHDYFHLAFKVGLFGLELARPPASTKPLEVLLLYQLSLEITVLQWQSNQVAISKSFNYSRTSLIETMLS